MAFFSPNSQNLKDYRKYFFKVLRPVDRLLEFIWGLFAIYKRALKNKLKNCSNYAHF